MHHYFIKAILLFVIILPLGCNDVPSECVSLTDQNTTLSFLTQVQTQQVSSEIWQPALRNKLLTELNLTEALDSERTISFQIFESEYLFDNIIKTSVIIESLLDRQQIPADLYYYEGSEISSDAHLLTLIHGHLTSVNDAIDIFSPLNGAVLTALDNGYIVLVPEIRSFGEYKINDLGHHSYVHTKADSEYLREVVADFYTSIEFLRQYFPVATDVTLAGLSLGGYISLHVGALNTNIDHTVVAGSFFPYSCINTSYHDSCQNFNNMNGVAELYDIAGLIAPRNLTIQFGAYDTAFTPVVDEMFNKTKEIFIEFQAEDSFQFNTIEDGSHELDLSTLVTN